MATNYVCQPESEPVADLKMSHPSVTGLHGLLQWVRIAVHIKNVGFKSRLCQ